MTCSWDEEQERAMPVENLVQHFGAVADPRCGGKIEHRLTDILVIAVCAVIACAESWDDIALYGHSKLDWLRTFLELPNGIPSHDTFRRVKGGPNSGHSTATGCRLPSTDSPKAK